MGFFRLDKIGIDSQIELLEMGEGIVVQVGAGKFFAVNPSSITFQNHNDGSYIGDIFDYADRYVHLGVTIRRSGKLGIIRDGF
jgi:hypothetical protein